MDKYKKILEQPRWKKIWQAALYIPRLSKRMGISRKSYSVTSQREMQRIS